MFSEGQEAETRDRNTNAISGSECATIVDCLIFAPFEDAFFPKAMMSKNGILLLQVSFDAHLPWRHHSSL